MGFTATAGGILVPEHINNNFRGTASFGEPQSSIDVSHISDYLGVFTSHNQEYYTPPVSMKGLIQLTYAHSQHGAVPEFDANMLLKYFLPNRLIKRKVLKMFAIDYRVTGNAYLQFIRNKMQQVIEVRHLSAINMRRLVEPNRYGWLKPDGTLVKFKKGEVFHLQDYDPGQQIYGIPYWFGAVQSILLGEDAILFPRRFFKNGAHTGNLFVTSGLMPNEASQFEKTIAGSTGVGNWKSAHVSLGDGDVDKVIKILPVGEPSKIEFKSFLNISATNVLEAWRRRPELLGMMPEGMLGSGDLDKIINMNYENEVIPYQQDIMEINDHLPVRYHIKFKEKEGNN
jgi:PBSX family phage portal protein